MNELRGLGVLTVVTVILSYLFISGLVHALLPASWDTDDLWPPRALAAAIWPMTLIIATVSWMVVLALRAGPWLVAWFKKRRASSKIPEARIHRDE